MITRQSQKGRSLPPSQICGVGVFYRGETTLYITPKALHIRLWGEWWDRYGPHIDFEPFVAALPETMHGWFHEMLRYARESGVATKLVDQLLGPDGPFVKTSLLQSASGAEVFSALAEANPNRGLECLEATIAKESTEELRANTAARRQLVWALERIAMWRPLFTAQQEYWHDWASQKTSHALLTMLRASL